jgi:hypothetical protein
MFYLHALCAVLYVHAILIKYSLVGLASDIYFRYTDFIVNEIAPGGTVVHLTNDRAPKFKPTPKVSLLLCCPSTCPFDLSF